ncbi:DEAD/DEAH box helicase [Micromonospora sagamiensis]|uniref:Superfamily II DNA/RNA helicase n=1 Tax=Micromonospora sagamiensis TaxID=47875 RepID=A0A562WCE3_9ACTN|nr:DEAD/DEAH box helicase [Micromonospora sagamiensis]TWJ27294.1 superfamily II DNA/RNA helicase [Micromonospora sagamiensis]BCL13815.1 DEAD/DEAH box helicase [Micromonospora sagamiensis]
MTTVIPSFADVGLRPELLAELSVQGIDLPFPIQAATLPDSLAGRDVLGRGRTGSGKTLAFGLPTLHRIAGQRARSGRPKALVLVPTRELAQQVTTALTPYANALGLRCATVVGGLSLQRQADALRAGAELVVATPGRLHDLIDRGDVRLGEVRVTVLDEADRMADMGFLPQVTKLLEQVAPDGQRMLFSATLDGGVDRLVRRFLTNPVSHSVDPGTATVTAMTHHVLHVDADDKPGTLAQIAAREGRTILFMGTKHRADRLARQLLARGVRAAALHGGKSQPQRTRILEQFKTGAVTALVATDVAARGIHVDGLDLVVNVDPPAEAKDYLHRGGRTARAGESGTVVTLVLPEQRRDVVKLMSVAGIKPHVVAVRPGDEALTQVTGAREPSGVPVTIPVPAATRSGAVGGDAAQRGPGAASTSGRPARSAGGAVPHRSSARSRRSRRSRPS